MFKAPVPTKHLYSKVSFDLFDAGRHRSTSRTQIPFLRSEDGGKKGPPPPTETHSSKQSALTGVIASAQWCFFFFLCEAIFLFNNVAHLALSKSQCTDQSLTLAGPQGRDNPALQRSKQNLLLPSWKNPAVAALWGALKGNLTVAISPPALYRNNFTLQPGH